MIFQLCFPWTAGAMLVMWTKFGKPHCNSGQTGSSKSPKAGVVVVILKSIEVLSRLPFVAPPGAEKLQMINQFGVLEHLKS
jgi:hypothetical protein